MAVLFEYRRQFDRECMRWIGVDYSMRLSDA